MAKIRIQGVPDEAGRREATRKVGALEVGVKHAFRLDSTRAGDRKAEAFEADPDDVIELEVDDGIRLWTTVDRFRDDVGPGASRGANGDEFLVPTSLQVGEPSRGIVGKLVIGAFRLLELSGFDLLSTAASVVSDKIEGGLGWEPGLYRCPDGFTADAAVKRVARPGDIGGNHPVLVFLHGTASCTVGSFGGLLEPEQRDAWTRIRKLYGDRIFALEHRTLSKSPIENAVDLVTALPNNARLHLVSHSRGGLVGELLCRKEIDNTDLDVFRNAERTGPDGTRKADVDALRQLDRVLKDRTPHVERFVRVACPARGTILASDRLDRYLSILANLVGLAVGTRANPIYDTIVSLALALAKKRTRPEDLPGIEAMMPDSPLVGMLNRPDVELNADLSAIAGDLVGAGVFGRLKAIATDLFYRENHDLVVNTAAMTGGSPRTDGARFFFHKGKEVNHFSYFRNAPTIDKLIAGLARPDGSDAGFEPIDPWTEKALKSRAPAARPGARRPVAFVLPGIMGSHLAADGDRLWFDPIDLATGAMTKLRIDAPRIAPDGLMMRAYGDLTEFLAYTHEIEEFAYDWRRSLGTEADRLAGAVSRKLDETGQPVRILAHSMGGLLARAMIVRHPEVWKQLAERDGSRLVMLGTPNGGSYSIPRALLGRDKMVRLLALIDVPNKRERILEVVAGFPGMLELLPAGEDADPFDRQYWKELYDVWGKNWVMPKRADLEAARELRKAIDRGPVDRDRMLYVAGRAPATPVGIEIDRGRKGRGRIRFIATSRGDGRVPWDTGPLDGMRVWYMDAKHGNLADSRAGFPAILDLLQSGDTDRLPRTPPIAVRGPQEYFELPDDEPAVFPDAGEVLDGVLDRDPEPAVSDTALPVRVSAAHGDATFVVDTVLVGHYEGDTLVSAERAIDRALGGRLAQNRELAVYPGPIETSERFTHPEAHGKPQAALVVGLGPVGMLTPGTLTRTVSRALRRHAVMEARDHPRSEGQGPFGIQITSLLIGTGAGALTVRDSVNAILEAVFLVNRSLDDSRLAGRVRIEAIRFVELYLDVAIEAARALHGRAEDARYAGRLQVDPDLETLPGARQRVMFEEDPDWWRRIQVASEEDGSLRFTTLTDRARAEVALQPTQRKLVDTFVEGAVGSAAREPNVASTLFELLIPNRLKGYAPQQQSLVLLLDKRSARYPWELLQDRADEITGGAGEPIAIRAGMVRQLVTEPSEDEVEGALGSRALVVGDPPSDFPELVAAQEEARLAATNLDESGYDTRSLIRPSFRDVIEALYARPYRILHLAGHGVYEHAVDTDRGQKTVTGMVLGEGVYLTPGEIRQMRTVPDLVFLNCCYLGVIQGGRDEPHRSFRHRLAANVSTQLIEMGVRAVVAAGWAVNDEAAATFASEFYRQMLRQRSFGDAVHQARRETYYRHPSSNTWGAYQCYGDPAFVLPLTTEGDRRQPGTSRLVSPREAILLLNNLTQETDTATTERLLEIRTVIVDRGTEFTERWGGDPEIRAALGRAFGAVDLLADAVRNYEAVLGAKWARHTVLDLEQLANLRCRQAVELATSPQDDGTRPAETPLAMIERSIQQLRTLPSSNPPGDDSLEGLCTERLALIGSAYKRMSTIASTAARRRAALRKMVTAYRMAHEAVQGTVDPYPLLNWLAGRVVLRYYGESDALDDLDRWIEAARDVCRGGSEFWDLVTEPDAAIVEALASRNIEGPTQQAIVDGYRGARLRGSPRKFKSVLEHFDWLVAVLDPGRNGGRRKKTAAGGTKRPDPFESARGQVFEAVRSIRARLADLEFRFEPVSGPGEA